MVSPKCGGSGSGICKVSPTTTTSCTVLEKIFFSKLFRSCGFSKCGGSGSGSCKASQTKAKSCTVLEKRRFFFFEIVSVLWVLQIWGVRQWYLQGFSTENEKLHSSRQKNVFFLKLYRFCGLPEFGGSGSVICKVSPSTTKSCIVLEKRHPFLEILPVLCFLQNWGIVIMCMYLLG